MNRVVFAAVLIVFFLTGKAFAYKNGDFQVWNTDVEELKLGDKAKLVFEEEFRWGDSAKDFYLSHYDSGYFYDLTKYLNIGGGYRRVYSKSNNKFRAEDEAYLTATPSWGLAGLKFDDRSRLEYRYFDYQDDSWRYRNKLTMKLPWKFTKFAIQPYLSDEALIRIDDSWHMNENRFSAGVGAALTKNVKVELYYMLQNTKNKDKWPCANVLGTKVKLVF